MLQASWGFWVFRNRFSGQAWLLESPDIRIPEYRYSGLWVCLGLAQCLHHRLLSDDLIDFFEMAHHHRRIVRRQG